MSGIPLLGIETTSKHTLMDFTVKRYSQLLHSLLTQGFSFLSVSAYIRLIPNFQSEIANLQSEIPKAPSSLPHAFVILRHDVDARPQNSLRLARLEHTLGIQGTYYFRIPHTFQPSIIQEIASLGHEIGYHYETMATIVKEGMRERRDEETKRRRDGETKRMKSAYELFVENLCKFREIVPVTTICMHGSPLSRYDNREIWQKYDYRDLGITGDAYLDIDFNRVAYFTDTGRRWNGAEVSIRDKVSGPFQFNLKTTEELIRAIPQFPDQVMITVHPQRWNDAFLPWAGELLLQNAKNIIKRILVKTSAFNRT
ncbi:MAG TPA: hypothetical protein PLV99_12905 [Prolixibacteraceae bacterium]|jgi:hypothetical protein|nr:hypothetical protein [Prolixibacteraceae bacterium]HOC87043.1 hypothetical protein [Prolixibacteraceae bacterium]HOG96635.1 hypothetical protein [Prolixibacteraceae bacterium]HPV19939.1 hypothetical protein [Prolixibacteraceae bacterium]